MTAPRIALLTIVLLATPALADVKPKEEKGPDAQGSGKGVPDEAKEKNPLPGIVEQMKDVERRIAESEGADKWTVEAQKRIAKALELEGEVVGALQSLIDKVESQPPSGGGEGDQQDRDQKNRSSGGKKQEQRPKERQQGAQEKPVDPHGREKAGQEREKNDQKAQNDKKRETSPEANAAARPDKPHGAGPDDGWGNLPPKAARELQISNKRQPPEQWRKLVEDYRRKLEEPKK